MVACHLNFSNFKSLSFLKEQRSWVWLILLWMHQVFVAIAKLVSTYINCGKTGHTLETCHNLERKISVVPTTTIKFTKLVTQTKKQLVKFVRIPI